MHRFGLREVALNARHHAVFMLLKTTGDGQQAARLVDHHDVLILIQDHQPGILRRIVVFHRHVRVPLLVSDDDQTQRVQTPSGLRQRIHHLLTVAFDRRQFVVTDVRVHRLQRFQTR